MFGLSNLLRGRGICGACFGCSIVLLLAEGSRPAKAQRFRDANSFPLAETYRVAENTVPEFTPVQNSVPAKSSSSSSASAASQSASQTSSASGEDRTAQAPEDGTPDLWTFLRRHHWIRESSEGRRYDFSVRAGFSLPQNDLRNTTGESPNLVVGAHAERLLRGVNQVRAVGEYWFFRQGHQQFSNGGESQQLDTKVRTLVLGGQYLYRIAGADKRFSIGGGLYLMRWSVASVNTLTLSQGTTQASGTSNWYHLGESLDATYRLSHRFELEGRWAHSHYGYEYIPVNVAQVGAAFRF